MLVKSEIIYFCVYAGASLVHNWSMECTHVLVDDLTPLKEDLIDAIVAKKPLASYKWVEVH